MATHGVIIFFIRLLMGCSLLPVTRTVKGTRWLWQPGLRVLAVSGLCVGVALRLGAVAAPAGSGATSAGDRSARVMMRQSIREVPGSTGGVQPALADPNVPRITRMALRADETSAPMNFGVSLKMRNFTELQQRLTKGEIISPAEMAEKYLPLAADYQATADWLAQQGFTIAPDSGGVVVFARGTVAQVRDAFQVSFARVAQEGAEFSSAITAPNVPASLAPALVGINGLQPHLRKHTHIVLSQAQPDNGTGFGAPYYPKDILKAYGADTLTQTGAGQTIAIVMDAFPGGNVSSSGNITNLTTFWTTVGVTRTGTYTALAVGSGPTNNASSIDAEEACLDSEWSSSIAPGANIRFYGTPSLGGSDLDLAYQQIYNDAIAHPEFGLHIVSLSYGGPESTAAQLQTDNNLFVQLVSAGITVFASSGDNGSSRGAESPASDPDVTGVGGTSINLDSSTGAVTSETAWKGSGGNASAFLTQPSWQTGTGTNAYGYQILRMVPDVAAPADNTTPAFVEFNNTPQSNVGGTSWSAPTWAGFAALINQARANNGLSTLALLGPKIYPLLGTASFRDITMGNNGSGTTVDPGFNASTGYDMITGIGVPVFPTLLQSLSTVVTPPTTEEVMPGANAVFSFIAANSATSFEWQREPAGSSTFSNLTNNGTFSGVTTNVLTINAATTNMSGDQFQCMVGNITTPPATLVVISQNYFATTPAGRAGVPGTNDGVGNLAQFNGPNDVAVDSSGNVYIADTFNNSIRRMTPTGNVITIAGSTIGGSGYVNDTGTSALFNFINSVDLDVGGNIYVADSSNNAIRKITPAGVVSTFAGSTNGTSGTSNGSAGNPTGARFNFPAGVAVSSSGNVYVADSKNNTIRRIAIVNGNLTISRLAGQNGVAGATDGTGTGATFNFPAAICVDASENLYVADANNNVIRKITISSNTGTVSTIAGKAPFQGVADGTASAARFNYPSGIAVDSSGNLFVTDTNNNSIRKITPAGVVTTVLGQAGVQGSTDGLGNTSQFNQPYGVAVSSSGILYIADTSNSIIRKAQIATAPQIQSPPANFSVLPGNSVSFTVTANGTPAPTYQWQRLPAGNVTWSNLSNDSTYTGTATAVLNITATTNAMNGDQFRVVLNNLAGTTTSSAATLTIQQAPVFNSQPVSQSGNVGDTVQFTASASGLPANITYQWQLLASGGSTWANLTDADIYTGSNTSTLTLTGIPLTLSGAQFRNFATNGVSPDATSNVATLTVLPTGYTAWAAGLNLAGGAATTTALSFNDTLPNLVRFALNLGSGVVSGTQPALSTTVVNNTRYLVLDYNVRKNLGGLQVIAQYSYNLQTWQNVTVGNIAQLADPNSQTAHLQAIVAVPASGTVFLRLLVQPAP